MFSIDTNISNVYFKYGTIIASMCIFIYVLYLASNDPTAIFTTSYIYLFVLLIPIGAIFFLLNDTIELKTIIYIVGLLLTIVFIYIGYNSKMLNMMFTGYLYYVFVFIITILTLAIVYNVAINNLQKQPGITGFIVNLIFYIPCLVSDAIKYLIADYKSTSQIVFVLFIIEIAIFLIYFYIFPYLTNLTKTDGNIIQGNPVFLNKTTVIPATTIQPITTISKSWDSNTSTQDDVYDKYNYNGNVRKNFTISLWSYLNPPTASRIAPNTNGKTPAQDKNSIYGANIFYYGTPSSMDLDQNTNTNHAPPFLDLSGGSYHPRLAYYIDLSDSYYVIDTNTDDANSRFELRLPMQRWNNFVFNYNANTVDIFVNGTLERTVKYSGIPNFQYNTDIMVIGSNPITYMGNMSMSDSPVFQGAVTSFMGLHGSVCNVVYYPTTLDQGQIVTNYNLLSMQNPPLPL